MFPFVSRLNPKAARGVFPAETRRPWTCSPTFACWWWRMTLDLGRGRVMYEPFRADRLREEVSVLAARAVLAMSAW